MSSVRCHSKSKEVVHVNDTWISDQLKVAQHVIPKTILSDQVVRGAACSLGKCQAEERRKFEVLFESLHHRVVQSKVGTRCRCFGPSYQWSINRNSILGRAPIEGM